MRQRKNIKYLLTRKVRIQNYVYGIGELIKSMRYIKRYYKPTPYPKVDNIMDEVYSGVLQSRLYLGSTQIPRFNTPSGAQDFKLRVHPGSIVHILLSQGEEVNNNNYSSKALYELTKYAQRSAQTRRSYKNVVNKKPTFSK